VRHSRSTHVEETVSTAVYRKGTGQTNPLGSSKTRNRKVMNKEQQQMIDKAYELYWNSNHNAEKTFQYEGYNIETRRMTKDEFIDMVKTDEEYGRRWGIED
jgi:hypothetical protein